MNIKKSILLKFVNPCARRSQVAAQAIYSILFIIALVSLPLRRAEGRVSFYEAQINSLRAQAESSSAIAVQQDAAPALLEQGKPVERELAGGSAHSFRVKLGAAQFLRAVVEQRGIDVLVRIYAPDGKQLTEIDSPNGSEGAEPLQLIADAAGEYRIEVRSLEQNAAAGRYAISILEIRAATDVDRKLGAAELKAQQAETLRAEGTVESLRNAIKIFEEAVTLFVAAGQQERAASSVNSIGEIYYGFGEKQKALDYFNRSLKLRRDLKDRAGEALVLNNLGVVYQSLGDRNKALEYYNQALLIQRETGNRSEEATTLSNMGHLYDLLGEKQKALEFYSLSLPLRRAVGDRQGEAFTLNNTGMVYISLGESQKALDYFNQALPLWRETGNRMGEATSINNIAYVYDGLGDKQSALKYYNQGLVLRRGVGDRAGEAASLNNIGLVHASLGEQQKALEYYSQALLLFKALSDPYGEATTLSNIGLTYTALNEYQKALDHLNPSLPIRRAIGDRAGEAHTLNNIGFLHHKRGELEKAAEFYEQSLALARAASDKQTEAKLLINLANLERSRNNLETALARIEAAIKIIESIRTGINSQQLRASFFASMQEYYFLYADILMRLHRQRPNAGHDKEALQVSERARARTLLEMLTEAGADIRQGVEPQLLERERSIQRQLNKLAEEQIRLLTGAHTAEQAGSAAKAIDELTRQFQEVQSQIRIKSPRYAALTQPVPLDLQTIQKELLDTDTVLLEYFLGQDNSYLWAVTADSIESYELPKREEIESSARRVYELIVASGKGVGGQTAIANELSQAQIASELAKESERLSAMLLDPVAARIGNKRLLIVADGALQYIPFGALPAPQNSVTGKQTFISGSRSPLMVEHEIVSLPSASTLQVLRREANGRQPASRAIAVFADPVFEKDDVRLKTKLKSAAQNLSQSPEQRKTAALAARDVSADDTARRIPRLPGTRREAEQILSLVPAGERKQALDFAANRSAATDAELGQYRIIHFATHGFLDSVHPELSGIVLSMFDAQGQPQDGFLRSHEIYNLRLSADVVVLSACQTGLGKEIKGEGLVGLTRGFMYAGAPRVVVSLWNVSDVATAELMTHFYRGMLKEKLAPAAALRSAQIKMWRQKNWKSPYYWAAFTVQGEWR